MTQKQIKNIVEKFLNGSWPNDRRRLWREFKKNPASVSAFINEFCQGLQAEATSQEWTIK